MNANITISQVWSNPSVMNFFFRTQAQNEFEKLVANSQDIEELFNIIEDKFDSLDDFEEFLYNESTEDINEYLYNI